MVSCRSFFKRGGALAHTIEYRFTPPILGHTAFITRISFKFSGLCFPHAGPVVRAGRLHLECSRMRRTLFITRHQCFSLREGILTCFSSPSPLRPPCPGLAFCRLGRGSGGRPPFVLPLFFLFFLPKRVRAEVSSLPKSRSGYPFWLKANCDPF